MAEDEPERPEWLETSRAGFTEAGIRGQDSEQPELIFREVEDRDLVGQARRGNVDAYNQLVSRWERRVFNYVLRLLGSREDALDITQDVFLKAYQNLGKLDDPARFSSWLYRIAHNEAFSLLRKSRPDREELQDLAPPPTGPRMLPVETTLAVTAALDRLSAEQKEAVVLKVYEGFKFEEIAEILGCPASTVKSRVYTGLDVLKTLLAPVAMGRGESR
ncbi:MAG: RNA polymerase sigma factor [Bryobacteraceae bacterium]